MKFKNDKTPDWLKPYEYNYKEITETQKVKIIEMFK
jgi:hypothetical protein